MNDTLIAVGSAGVLGAGLGSAIALSRAGVPRTYVRDLVHIGAFVWVLGWPLWRSAVFPIAITALAFLLALVGPRALRAALSGDDERWSGVVVYVLAYAAFTAIAFTDRLFPAAAALLALSWGDGVGGAVGRRFGRHHFRAPGGKQKSFEGSGTVAAVATLGVLLASLWFPPGEGVARIVAAGLIAALVEAAAPRATDNALVPLGVWLFLRFT